MRSEQRGLHTPRYDIVAFSLHALSGTDCLLTRAKGPQSQQTRSGLNLWS